MTYPTSDRPSVIPETIIPEDEWLFFPWLRDRLEEISDATNARDFQAYQMSITSTAQNIINVPNFGAFIICVSGTTSTLPTLVAALVKSDAAAAGTVASLTSQAGTGSWNTFNLTITSTSTNFQIAHNNTGITGNFSIRLVATQL